MNTLLLVLLVVGVLVCVFPGQIQIRLQLMFCRFSLRLIEVRSWWSTTRVCYFAYRTKLFLVCRRIRFQTWCKIMRYRIRYRKYRVQSFLYRNGLREKFPEFPFDKVASGPKKLSSTTE